MKSETLSLKTIIKKLDFLRKQLKKDLLLLATKLAEEIVNPRNAKEHYQSFIRKKDAKLVKKKRITQKPKFFKNPNIVWIKIGYYRVSKKLHINYPRLYSRLKSRSQ